eukprot:RCo049325
MRVLSAAMQRPLHLALRLFGSRPPLLAGSEPQPGSSSSSSSLSPTSVNAEEYYRQWHDYYAKWHQYYYGHLYPAYPYSYSYSATPGYADSRTGAELSQSTPYSDGGASAGQPRSLAWLLFLGTVWTLALSLDISEVTSVEKASSALGKTGRSSSSSTSSSSSSSSGSGLSRSEAWQAGVDLFSKKRAQKQQQQHEQEQQPQPAAKPGPQP